MWSSIPFVLDEILLPIREPEIAVAIKTPHVPCSHPTILEWKSLRVGFFVVLVSLCTHL
jgi:hypothetical protein